MRGRLHPSSDQSVMFRQRYVSERQVCTKSTALDIMQS